MADEVPAEPKQTKARTQRSWHVVLLALLVVIALGAAALGAYRQSNLGEKNEVPIVAGCNGTVALNDYSLEEALDADSQARGLSGRPSLPEKCGMLFVFDHVDEHGIWMKDMKFNLDIMWLDESKRIISIRENAPYNSYPEVYSPQAASKYVIELNAGQARAGAFRVGQVLSFNERPAAEDLH